ncbi:hypothetical protein [Sphingomonas soli]|nr:hypothetical protein [Sphingomonas soli]
MGDESTLRVRTRFFANSALLMLALVLASFFFYLFQPAPTGAQL